MRITPRFNRPFRCTGLITAATTALLAVFQHSIVQAEEKPSQPPALIRGLVLPDAPVAAPNGRVAIAGDQTIVVLGGTNALETQHHGYLETIVAAGYPQYRLQFRNLAWHADTVYRQQRPRNFFLEGLDPPNEDRDHRRRIEPGTVILWMGQIESLDGPPGLADFLAAYEGIVDHLVRFTPSVVLVTPVPFEDPLKLGLDVAARNRDLATYATGIRQLAKKKNLPVVELFNDRSGIAMRPLLTRNGQHLSEIGHWLTARQFVEQLGLAESSTAIKLRSPEGTLSPDGFEMLRQQVVAKNELWQQYWRPTNWAFLYGNRQFVASSYDHRDSKRRWFPDEIESLVPMLESAEAKIHQTVVDLSPASQ